MAQAIALLTDFGLADIYVGQMKAVLANLSPSSRLLDISHDVEPFNLVQAGFFLAASYPYLQEGTVVVAVVDPTVGTDRRIVALKMEDRFFLAPDNGLLSLLLARNGRARAFDLSRSVPENLPFATFHGRDVFAPLAAKLASGTQPQALGREISVQELVTEPWGVPSREKNGIKASILHVDRFGNCVTNLETSAWLEELRQAKTLGMARPERLPLRLVETYAQLPGKTPGLLPGSQGFLEIAFYRNSAAKNLALSIGESIHLTLP